MSHNPTASSTETSQQRLIKKIKIELGSLCLQALENPNVIEIMLNSDGTLWIEELGKPIVHVGSMQENKVKALLGTIASYLNTTITSANPILECELPIDGSRFEGLLPPIVNKPTFTIRKKASQIFTLEEYYHQKVLSQEQYFQIKKAIYNPEDTKQSKKNILIVGGTGSGKTTLANAIIDGIVQQTPNDRVVIIEDTAEIQCAAKNAVILRTSDKVNMLMLLRATMRLRPDRILVGEVRGAEALDLLKSWNTGHSGGVATIHANSARAGLTRLELLISEATTAPMQTLIAEAINIIIFISKTTHGRKIKEVIEITGYDEFKKEYIIQEHSLKHID
ncbi:MAG: Conjugative transfer protein TrbB [uncultured Sulfurovum sp.]|uniref:Conjugative transfer protein TrbB n=1 Tax=uncultured Sulfurovum sp. TaxID=269237 RepID=A0A6S6T3A6_9BACT|nr:MAG: Conjugative transfer protein TrbB [uncultured Sulfurovum sp.]